jgi:hypothetical protein
LGPGRNAEQGRSSGNRGYTVIARESKMEIPANFAAAWGGLSSSKWMN